MKCNNPIRINQDSPDEAIVPCGYCWQCKDTRFKEWVFRLKEEWKSSYNGWFITLTYDQENLPIITSEGEILKGIHNRGSPSIYMPHVSDFMKALRQKQDQLYSKYRKEGKDVRRLKIRFYAVGEYGAETMRPHYHLLIFNLYDTIDIHSIWKKGHIAKEVITEGRIKYVSGYILDKDKYPKGSLRPTPRMSQGIGRAYVDRAKNWHIDNEELYSPTMGKKSRIGRYLTEKIFKDNPKLLEEIKIRLKEYHNKEDPDSHNEVRQQKNQDVIKIKARKRKSQL